MKTPLIASILFIISYFSFSQTPTNGLSAYYPFNGNANDESGNGNNGTVTGATLVADRFGNSSSAYSFNGTSNYINCGTSTFGITNRVSVCCWMKLVNSFTTPNRNLLAKYNWTQDRGFQLGTTPQGNIGFGGRDGNNEYSGTGSTTFSLADNQWHFLVSICDSNLWQLWVDGILKLEYNSNNINTSIISSDPLCIGKLWQDNSGFYSGYLDDIRIYNRVLNSSEISSLYTENQCTATVPVANDTTVCGGGVYTLSASGGTYYLWYNVPVGGTYLSIGSTYTTPLITGTTTYYVANYDGGCESSRTPVTITVNPLPNTTITGLNTGYCINASPITLTGSPSGGTFSGSGLSGDLFTPANANIGTNSISYSYTNPSTGCSKTVNQNVSVYNSPAVSISGLNPSFNLTDSPVTLTGNPSGGTFVGDGVSGNTFSPSIAGAGSHTVVYIYNDGNGCSNATCETTDISTAKSEIFSKENEVNVYPNPNSGSFNVSYLLTKNETVIIKVINNLGEIIYTESNKKSKGNYKNTINLSLHPDGIYYIDVEIGERNYSEIISVVK